MYVLLPIVLPAVAVDLAAATAASVAPAPLRDLPEQRVVEGRERASGGS